MKRERMTCMARVLATACVISCGMLGTTYAATYYVSKSGSNSNSCATAQSPGSNARLTIGAGAACLSSGDTLLIQAGTYAENMIGSPEGSFPWQSGTVNQYTRYARYQNDTVIVRPSGGGRVLYMNGPQYITIDGLVLDGTSVQFTTIKLDAYQTSTEFIRLQNCEVIGNSSGGDFMGILGGSHSQFLKNNIHGSGNYCVYNPGHDNLWDGNTIHDCGGYGIHSYNTDGGVNNNVFRNNTLYNLGFNAFCADSYTCNTPAIIMYKGDNNSAYNNVIYNNWSGIAINYSSNSHVYNNTLYNNSQPECIDASVNVSGAVIRNNICYQSGTIATSSDAVLSDNLTANPLFVDAAKANFHLQSGSPAIDQGLTISTVNHDRDGNLRPQGGAYDIGAYEYGKQVSLPKNLRIVSTK
jgi:parallel beta-helix repeat protein